MKKQKSDTLVIETLRIFYRTARKNRRAMWLSLSNPLGAILMSVAVPYYAGKVFAGLAHQSPSLDHYLFLLGCTSVLGVIANRIGFTQFMLLQARTMDDLHQMVFARLIQRSVGFHTNRISGKLISDAIDFVSSFGMLVSAILINGFSFLAVIIVGVIVVFINTWQLGAFLTMTVAITLGWTWLESRKRSELRNTRLVATKNLTAHLSDSIVNAQTVKTFAGETFELKENARLNKVLRTLRERDWQRAGRSGSNRMGALLILQFAMILFLLHIVRAHPQTLATGIFAFTYTFSLTNRLFDLNNLTRQVEEAFLNAAPMTKMLMENIEIVDHEHAKPLAVTGGEIVLDNVSFAYKEKSNTQQVFSNFDLTIHSGEKVGLVGPSGGGKSTLTRLLLRFDEVQDGHILIDGQDIEEVTQVSLRSSISYVPQEPLLFHRTIRENIVYGRPQATEAAIIEAAKKANAHSFIERLPNGYETVVGERGVKLSGGQRQRIAIARAILKDAPILILDEATSALDSENEQEVQHALWELMKGRTVMVIAHRLSTIQKMDRIVVLVEGKIVEEGPHAALLKRRGGMYAKLWKHQSGGFIEE